MPEYQIFVPPSGNKFYWNKISLYMPLLWVYMSLTTFILFTDTAPRSDVLEIKLLPGNKTGCYGSSSKRNEGRINLAIWIILYQTIGIESMCAVQYLTVVQIAMCKYILQGWPKKLKFQLPVVLQNWLFFFFLVCATNWFRRKLRKDWTRVMLATIQSRTFCLLVCYLKT
jgi:hypothetical protein